MECFPNIWSNSYLVTQQKMDRTNSILTRVELLHTHRNLLNEAMKIRIGSIHCVQLIAFPLQIGIAFSTAKFGLKKGSLFGNEPLKTTIGKGPIPKGLYFSTRFQMPDACDGSFCKLAQKILGQDTWFQFTGTVWTTSFKITSTVFDRVIKDELKFKKIETFIEVC